MIQDLVEINLAQNPLLNLIFTLLIFLIFVAYYTGQYSEHILSSQIQTQREISEISEEIIILENLIDKKTKDRYTNKEAIIQQRATEIQIYSLMERLKTLENLCFK